MEEAPTTTNPSAGRKSHLEYCDQGFRTTSNSRVDLTRLGALCGVSNGLTRVWSHDWLVDGRESGDGPFVEQELRGASAAAGCGRFAIGFVHDNEAPELVVDALARDQRLSECRLSQSGFCPSHSLVCNPTRVKLQLARGDGAEEPGDATSSTPQSPLKVNVEWWALPGVSRRTTGSIHETPTPYLPSGE
jgi:hypothetical protein